MKTKKTKKTNKVRCPHCDELLDENYGDYMTVAAIGGAEMWLCIECSYHERQHQLDALTTDVLEEVLTEHSESLDYDLVRKISLILNMKKAL